MSHYLYRCTACERTFDPQYIEKEFHYLCPLCGSVQRNQPLRGVLSVEYDYAAIPSPFDDWSLSCIGGGRMWDTPGLLPLSKRPNSKILERCALRASVLLPYTLWGGKFFVQDDTLNPTLSFKDRASILTILKARELGIREVAAASTGNAGSSLAGIGARLGMKTHIFGPASMPEAKRIQIQSYGANLYLVDGSYDDAFDLCLEVCEKKKWYNRNTAYNPMTIEGKKSVVYDIQDELEKKVPGHIFVPAGDGVITHGVYKGYFEMFSAGWISRMPKIVAVQAEGSDAIYRYWKTGKFEYKPANSVADSICAGAPRNLYMANSAIKATDGEVIVVSDEEILTAQKKVAFEMGRIIEPAAAASLAGYLKHKEMYEADDRPPVLLFTGHGLKDTAALQTWNTLPVVKSYAQWLETL
jgi:threonine synthase